MCFASVNILSRWIYHEPSTTEGKHFESQTTTDAASSWWAYIVPSISSQNVEFLTLLLPFSALASGHEHVTRNLCYPAKPCLRAPGSHYKAIREGLILKHLALPLFPKCKKWLTNSKTQSYLLSFPCPLDSTKVCQLALCFLFGRQFWKDWPFVISLTLLSVDNHKIVCRK